MQHSGWFEFKNTVLEFAATPLLSVQSDPTLSYSFEGLYSILVEGYQHQDSCEFVQRSCCDDPGSDTSLLTAAAPYRCLDTPEENAQPLATVAHLNCSQPNCAINGLSISGAGFQSGPAVRVRGAVGLSAQEILFAL